MLEIAQNPKVARVVEIAGAIFEGVKADPEAMRLVGVLADTAQELAPVLVREFRKQVDLMTLIKLAL